jgi:predicted membrane channel-forming protein YqfA (hemolysin III family)
VAYRAGVPDDSHRKDENKAERLDRNLSELLQELRVALPGVQVLFAFLLAVPFAQGFTKITPFQERVFFATLLLTALSAVLLISPTSYHRMNFRMGQKEQLLAVANKLAIVGLAALALAMTGAIVLITDYLFGATATVVTGVLAFLVFVLFWYVLPLQRRVRLSDDED